jgi:hypothetical protein
MKGRNRFSVLFFIGIFAAGSTALGYYYFFVYSPPLKAAIRFMDAMEARNQEVLRPQIIISSGVDDEQLREPTDYDLRLLLSEPFPRGRILDERKREGKTRDYYYLVYREPDGRVYALVATNVDGRFRIVIPETPMSKRHRYLWDYIWTN